MVLDASVVAALIAAFGALVAYWLGQRQAAVERKRRTCAEAIADALKWLELPYRIRRRVNDSAETLGSLAQRISDLRERLEFHEKWLGVEIPEASPDFQNLVKAVMIAAGPAIESAWKTSPVQSASQMNVGQLFAKPAELDTVVEAFSSQVRKHLAW